MPRKRNEFGQFVPKDYNLYISFPNPLTIIKFLLIMIIVSPWIFILSYKLDLESIQKMMEKIFIIKSDDTKKSNGFF